MHERSLLVKKRYWQAPICYEDSIQWLGMGTCNYDTIDKLSKMPKSRTVPIIVKWFKSGKKDLITFLISGLSVIKVIKYIKYPHLKLYTFHIPYNFRLLDYNMRQAKSTTGLNPIERSNNKKHPWK